MQGAGQETVLVTGASGFLGRRCRPPVRGRGVASGDRPRAWAVLPTGRRRSGACSLRRAGDVTLAELRAIGETRRHRRPLRRRRAGRPLSSRIRSAISAAPCRRLADVLEFIRHDAPAARLVYPSSAAVYGNARRLPIRTADTGRPLSPYGTHKRGRRGDSAAPMRSISASVAQCFASSRSMAATRKQLLWDACRRLTSGSGAFSGTGAELRDWLHAEDAAALFVEAARIASADCPTANGGTGIGTPVGAILTRLAAAMAPEDRDPLHRLAAAGRSRRLHRRYRRGRRGLGAGGWRSAGRTASTTMPPGSGA